MWNLLNRRIQLIIVVAVTVLLTSALDAVHDLWLGTTPGPLKWVSLTAMILGTALAGAANASWRWIWRTFPFLGRLLFPDLNGTWTGHLQSTWKKPGSDETLPPIPATITIRQGLFTTNVALKTGESISHSTRVILEAFRNAGRFRIWYTYNNDPQAQYQHRSSPHEGVAFLELDLDAGPGHLTGSYYTARKTIGDLTFSRDAG